MHAARGRARPPRWARGRTRAQLPLCHTICSIAGKGVAAPARTTQLQLAEQSAARGTCSGHLRHALAAIEAKATNRSGGKLRLCNQRQKHTRLPLRSSPRCSRSTLSFLEPPSLSRPGPSLIHAVIPSSSLPPSSQLFLSPWPAPNALCECNARQTAPVRTTGNQTTEDLNTRVAAEGEGDHAKVTETTLRTASFLTTLML